MSHQFVRLTAKTSKTEWQFGRSWDLGSLNQPWRRRAAQEGGLVCLGLGNKGQVNLLYEAAETLESVCCHSLVELRPRAGTLAPATTRCCSFVTAREWNLPNGHPWEAGSIRVAHSCGGNYPAVTRELHKLDCEVTNVGCSTHVSSSLAVCVEKRYISAVYMPCSTLKLYFLIIGDRGHPGTFSEGCCENES